MLWSNKRLFIVLSQSVSKISKKSALSLYIWIITRDVKLKWWLPASSLLYDMCGGSKAQKERMQMLQKLNSKH